MSEEREVRRAFAAAAAASKKRDDWAAVARNFERVVDGVACNLHLKIQLMWQRGSAAPRVTGECFVLLSAPQEGDFVGGTGWAHFALSEAGLGGAWHLFAVALAEAAAEIRAKPEFAARAERAALSATVADAAHTRRGGARL